MKTLAQKLFMILACLGPFWNLSAQSIEWEFQDGVSGTSTLTGSRNSESRFYTKNRLCPNEDGSFTFSWSNLSPGFKIGFTNENSSAQDNGTQTYGMVWNPHPYGDKIEGNLGAGLQTISSFDREYYYDDQNVQHQVEYTYTATISRVGGTISIVATGGSMSASPEQAAEKSLMLDGTFYRENNKISGLSLDFHNPVILSQNIDAEGDLITVSASEGKGGYTYNWTTPSGTSSGSSVSTTSPGAYTVTVSDGRDACNITRTFHHVGDAKPIELVHDRDLAGSGVCELSSEFNGTMYQITQNNKSATFESKNRMSAGENGILTFSFDPRATHNSRIGFTNYEASAAFNANVQYYIEWNTHPYGESIRINLGDGFETISIPHFSDGHIEKNIHVECKLERDGDWIKATVDIDGQVNEHIYREREISGLSDKQLTLDGWMYRHTSNDAYWSKFNDINVNFATPIEFETYTIAEDHKANIDISGGSESYTIEWTSTEGTSGQMAGSAGMNLVDFQEPGIYTVTVTDVTDGYDQAVYTKSRVIHILDNVQKISLTHERDLAGSGTCQLDQELNATISQIDANNKSATFESLNRMSPFEDGALTFSFDSRDSYNSRIGFTSYESSASVNANVHYYVEWNEHPYGETIRVNFGDGIETISVPRYGDGSLPKDIHVAGKIERIGSDIKITLDVDGQANFHWEDSKTIPGVETKELTVNGYSYKHTSNPIYDAKFKNVNVNFSSPIDFTDEVVMNEKKVTLNISGADDLYNVVWKDFATGAEVSADNGVGNTYTKTLTTAGTYLVTVTDGREGADEDVYTKSRVYHIIDYPKSIVINNERALGGGGKVSNPTDAVLTSDLFNAQTASFETENKLSINEDGALLFAFNSRNNYNQRIGLTGDLSSSAYNANVHYYVEWAQHVSGCEVRVNVGNGVEKVLIPRWDDGNHLRDVRVTGKLERVGDVIRATIDIDGQPINGALNTHRVFEKEIEGISNRYLVVDAMTFQATREDQRSRFENVNVTFATPIELDYTIDQSEGAITLLPIGGSGNYTYEWYNGSTQLSATTASITGLEKGEYKAVVKDAKGTEGFSADDYKIERTFFILGGEEEMTLTSVAGGETTFENGDVNVTSNSTYFISDQIVPAQEDASVAFTFEFRETNAVKIGFSEAGAYHASNHLVEFYAEIYNVNSGIDIRLYDGEGSVEKVYVPRYTDGHVHKNVRVAGLIERIDNQMILKVVLEGQHNEVFTISRTDDAIRDKELVVDGLISYSAVTLEDVALFYGSEVELITSEAERSHNTGCKGSENGVAEYTIDQANGAVNWIIVKDDGDFATGTNVEGELVRYENLEPGVYTIAFEDEVGKTTSHDFTIDDTSTKVSAQVASVSDITCFEDGVVKLEGLDGVGPYSFTWAKVSGDDTLEIGSGDSVLYKFAGTYDLNVTVTDLGDEEACPTDVPLAFSINEGDRVKIEGLKIVVDPITCTKNTHTFSLEGLPTDGDFTIWWRTWDAESDALITRSRKSEIYSLSYDGEFKFFVQIRDASGKYCRMYHEEIIVARADEVSVDPEFEMDGCDKVKIKLNPSDDVTKVRIKGFNASSRENINFLVTGDEATIDAGLYTNLQIIAKNDEGCSNPKKYSNKDLSAESDDISVNFTSIDPLFCDQAGRVELNVTGVTSADRVTWSYAKYTRPVTEVIVNAPGQPKYQRSTLPADFTHYVTITDEQGCVYNFSEKQEMRAQQSMDWDISVFRDPTCNKKGLLQTENFTGLNRSNGSFTRYFYVGDEAIYDRKKEGKYNKMKFDEGTYPVRVDMYLWLGGHDYCHVSKTETVTFVNDCEMGSGKMGSSDEQSEDWLVEDQDEEEATNEFKAYPNPTSGIVRFEFDQLVEGSQLKIYSMDGRLLVNQEITQAYLELDLSSYGSGIYLYQVTSPQGQLKSGRVFKN